MPAPKKNTFEQSLNRLEAITQQLEKGEMPLEDSIALFEEGVRLSKECMITLNELQGRIVLLTKQNDQLVEIDFEPEA